MEYNVDSREVTLIGRPYGSIAHSYWLHVAGTVALVALVLSLVVAEPIILFGLAAFAIFLVACKWSAESSRRRMAGYADRTADPDLICYGNVDDLQAVADLANVSTEPHIVQLYGHFPKQYFTPNAPWFTNPNRFVLLVFLPIWCGGMILFWPLRGLDMHFYLLALAAYFCANWIIFPIYLRVTPGQMEILCFGPFRMRAGKSEPILLEHAHIELDFSKRKLSVWHRGGAQPERVIPLGGVRDVQGLARAVFACAIAPPTMPPLPDDELLG